MCELCEKVTGFIYFMQKVLMNASNGNLFMILQHCKFRKLLN